MDSSSNSPLEYLGSISISFSINIFLSYLGIIFGSVIADALAGFLHLIGILRL
ncbi:MAG: hypothetical protein QXP91_06850 [Candidatus Methanomethylicia archaeon]